MWGNERVIYKVEEGDTIEKGRRRCYGSEKIEEEWWRNRWREGV